VQHLRRLSGRRRLRQAEDRFVVEGSKLLAEALDVGAVIEAVFIDAAAASGAERDLAEACARAGADVLELQPGVLARACDTVTPQPIAGVVRTVDVAWADLWDLRPDLVVICAEVRDPGNLGSIIRAAGAAGAGAVICCTGSVDMYNPKAVRASAGVLFRVPVVAGVSAQEALSEVGEWGLQRWGTAAHAGLAYTEADLVAPAALVLGNEAFGLPDDVAALLDGTLRIPMSGGIESLNVATAAAVLCFEAARQRATAGGSA
jgi:TrmH family RNA methyltransferase